MYEMRDRMIYVDIVVIIVLEDKFFKILFKDIKVNEELIDIIELCID